jgi:hypothetical protein
MAGVAGGAPTENQHVFRQNGSYATLSIKNAREFTERK